MNKIKNKGIIGVLLGLTISKIIGKYYGYSADKIIIYALASISIILALYGVIKKQYILTLFILIIFIPVNIIVIGLYLNNNILFFGGIFSIFIIFPLIIKILGKKRK